MSQAERLIKELHRACYVLGAWGEYGRARDEVGLGLRSLHVIRYVAFYRIKEDAIEIVRVLDERRDIDAIF